MQNNKTHCNNQLRNETLSYLYKNISHSYISYKKKVTGEIVHPSNKSFIYQQ